MQYAVLTGVGISVILFVARQSNRVTVKRWQIGPGVPLPTESDPPKVLPAGEVVVLTPYGSLFFASATVFESQLPVPGPESGGSVVVLRLRGNEELGSTFIKTIIRYHDLLEAARGVTKTIHFERHETCTECDGSGAKAGSSRTKCNYCGSLIFFDRASAGFYYVIPFKLSQNDAIGTFRRWAGGSTKAKDLDRQANITAVKKVYFPVYMFRRDVDGREEVIIEPAGSTTLPGLHNLRDKKNLICANRE